MATAFFPVSASGLLSSSGRTPSAPVASPQVHAQPHHTHLPPHAGDHAHLACGHVDHGRHHSHSQRLQPCRAKSDWPELGPSDAERRKSKGGGFGFRKIKLPPLNPDASGYALKQQATHSLTSSGQPSSSARSGPSTGASTSYSNGSRGGNGSGPNGYRNGASNGTTGSGAAAGDDGKELASAWDIWEEEWDPVEGLPEEEVEKQRKEAEAFRRAARERPGRAPRDKWMVPLLDSKTLNEAFDPDQERSEAEIQDEAAINKEESILASRFMAQLIGIPLVTGFVISRALAEPVLTFTKDHNQNAFDLTYRQKLEAMELVHAEEGRIRMDLMLGRVAPVSSS